MSQYPVTLTKDGSQFLATFKDVPEAITFGKSEKEALENAVDALETGLSFYTDAAKEWPEPSPAVNGEKLVFISHFVTIKNLSQGKIKNNAN
jgi:antitoxin HicB